MKVEATAENFAKQQLITNEIDKHLRMIHHDTAHMSTHNHTVNHDSFKSLVAMGDKIIPYIFHKMTQYGGSWTYFLLLHEITKEQPVDSKQFGNFIKSTIAWLQWYVQSKYYPSDIYFGLVK